MYHNSPQFSTAPTKSKPIAVNFNGGKLTSDAGTILLPLVDRKIGLLDRIDQIIFDPRDPRYIAHQQRELLAQRIYGIAIGYEDGNDHTQLRKDPALLTVKEKTTDCRRQTTAEA